MLCEWPKIPTSRGFTRPFHSLLMGSLYSRIVIRSSFLVLLRCPPSTQTYRLLKGAVTGKPLGASQIDQRLSALIPGRKHQILKAPSWDGDRSRPLSSAYDQPPRKSNPGKPGNGRARNRLRYKLPWLLRDDQYISNQSSNLNETACSWSGLVLPR